MADTRTPARPQPPTRIARWAAPAAVGLFAVLGAAQADRRDPVVLAVAAAVAVVAAALMSPDRPALLPVFAVVSAVGLGVLANGAAANVGWFGVCVLVGWLASIGSMRATVGLWAASVVTFALEWSLTTDDRGWISWVAGTTFTAVGFLLGRRQRDLAAELRVAQAGLADRVRAEERNRIARELHDVIAHSLTVSLLHVSSARLAVEEDPGQAVRALREAERLSRACLSEVRQVVGLLRRDGEVAAPLPGAADLTALVAQFRDAGADVRLRVDGRTDELGATVGLALYRILQESLTNAARHAPDSGVRAVLSVSARSVELVVDSFAPAGSATGSGLVSMRERAEMIGGGCTAGAVGTGWRVHATLPLRTEIAPAALA